MKEFLKTLGHFLEFGTKVADPTQYDIKELKRLKYRVEAAMQYVFTDEESGRYELMDEKDIKKYKLHWRKRIFDAS